MAVDCSEIGIEDKATDPNAASPGAAFVVSHYPASAPRRRRPNAYLS